MNKVAPLSLRQREGRRSAESLPRLSRIGYGPRVVSWAVLPTMPISSVTAALDPETQRFVDAAIAGAPPLTSDQIVELRRIIKPEQRMAAIRAGTECAPGTAWPALSPPDIAA